MLFSSMGLDREVSIWMLATLRNLQSDHCIKMGCVMMGSVAEKLDLKCDEEIPISSSQTTNKMVNLQFEAYLIASPPRNFRSSRVLRKIHQIRFLKSVYIVVFSAKINVLLPFGPLAILLHYLTDERMIGGVSAEECTIDVGFNICTSSHDRCRKICIQATFYYVYKASCQIAGDGSTFCECIFNCVDKKKLEIEDKSPAPL